MLTFPRPRMLPTLPTTPGTSRLRVFVFVDLYPSLLGNGYSIHHVGLLRNALVQHSLDGGIPDQLGVPFRDPSTVAKGNLLYGPGRGYDVGQKRSQLFRQGNVRPHQRVLLVIERRHVDGVLDHT